MEKAAYELNDRSEADDVQLFSGSIASSPVSGIQSRSQMKIARQFDCKLTCCVLALTCISLLALCAGVAALVLVVAFPNVNNPAIQEVLDLRKEFESQLATTSTPSTDTESDKELEELIRIRETLETSLSAISSSLEGLLSVQESQNGSCPAPPEPLIGTFAYPASSCRDISQDRPSGDYWIQTNATSCPVRVYCDLTRSACSCRCTTQEGGWMRVANFDMTDLTQSCPDGFTQVNSTLTDPPLRLCGRPGPIGCSSMIFPVNGIEYSQVCGRIKAYRHATPDAFHHYNIDNSINLDGNYFDGVSITYGNTPRSHIWTFVAAWQPTANNGGCPCSTTMYEGTVPPFIGQDYFCESGQSTTLSYELDTEDPLWDGNGCVSTSTCCLFNNPPYFCKALPASTTNDIEVRLCGNQETVDEDTPIEAIELFVY